MHLLIVALLSIICNEIKHIKITLLELNEDCMQQLLRVDNKWSLRDVEIAYIEFLCQSNRNLYKRAVHDFEESLSHDLSNVSKTCLI